MHSLLVETEGEHLYFHFGGYVNVIGLLGIFCSLLHYLVCNANAFKWYKHKRANVYHNRLTWALRFIYWLKSYNFILKALVDGEFSKGNLFVSLPSDKENPLENSLAAP